MSILSYSYVDENGASKSISLDDALLSSEVSEAKDDYDVAKNHLQQIYYPIWREGYKMYHLSTSDRKSRIKPWQQNAATGFVRSVIDIFVSTLTENPIVFNVRGINEEGVKNADNIKRALAFSADVGGFQNEVKASLKNALKTGMFSFEINIIPESTPRKYVVYKDGPDGKKIPKEIEFSDDEISNVPYAKHTSVFNIFPDPYNKNQPRYIAKRLLLDEREFFKRFGAMINSDDNKSPLKDIAKYIPINDNGADFIDYDDVIEGVHQEKANDVRGRDSWVETKSGSSGNISGSIGSGIQRAGKKNPVEVVYYTRDDIIVLFANNYPVFVGDNKLKFIPMEIQSSTDQDRGIDCEGAAYLVGDISRLIDAFFNSLADQVRQVSNPFYVGIKGSFLDEDSIKDVEPGDIMWAEDEAGAKSLRRFDHGSVTDFGILNILFDIGTRLTGISEYNSGISARERTATGALAVTQSSQRRLSPFLQSFISVVSRIAEKFLMIIKEGWTDERYVLVIDEANAPLDADGNPKTKLSNMDLGGAVLITLQMDSIFSAINEFMYKKLLEVYRETQSTGLINEDEVTREMFRSQGLNPDKFVPKQAPKMTPPKDAVAPGPLPGIDAGMGAFTQTPEMMAGQDLQSLSNPQTNFGG